MFSRYLTKFSIYFILIILLFYSNILYANCINFIPYYYTGKSHKIIENKEFCVKNFSEKNIVYKSDEFGARIISNYPNKPKKVYFGDSQLLGLDVNAKEHNFFSDTLNSLSSKSIATLKIFFFRDKIITFHQNFQV